MLRKEQFISSFYQIVCVLEWSSKQNKVPGVKTDETIRVLEKKKKK